MDGASAPPSHLKMILGKKKSYFVSDMKTKGDNLIITHTQYTDHIKASAKFVRDNSDNGFTKDRQMQLIGRIPTNDFLKNAERFCPDGMVDQKAVCKWLNSDDGRDYRTTQRPV